MRRLLAALLAVQSCAVAQPRKDAADVLAPQPPPPALTDEVIRKAVRETIAEDPRPAPAADNRQAGAYRAAPMEARMRAAFEQAKVPDCLHPDALKLQPAHIGPVAVVGPYSLPWVIAAAARGKCH